MDTAITITAAMTIRPALLKFLLLGSVSLRNDQYRSTATLSIGTRATIIVTSQPGTEIGLISVPVVRELIFLSRHAANISNSNARP
jgi:hypothetical protein